MHIFFYLRFSYTKEQDETHGNYVTSINQLENEGEWNWLVYDPRAKKLLKTGIPFISFSYKSILIFCRYLIIKITKEYSQIFW